MKQNRIAELDIAKGIGIFLVVVGHLIDMHSYMGRIIYSFHMPLFFLLSGICFNERKYDQWHFFENRLRTLLWPCLVFTVIVSILQACLLDIPFTQLRNELPGALWFLPILFISEVLYFYIRNWNKIVRAFVIFATFFIFVMHRDVLESFPYKLNYLPKAFLFYGLGHILKNAFFAWINKVSVIPNFQRIFISSAFAIVLFLLVYIHTEVYIFYGMVYVITAMTGILMVFSISTIQMKVMKKPILFLGENTLVIMATHVFFLRFCIYYVQPLTHVYLTYKLIEFIFVWSMTLFNVYVINKYIPWFKRI